MRRRAGRVGLICLRYPLSVFWRFQGFEVGQIFRAPRGALVGAELIEADNRQVQARDVHDDLAGIAGVELDAIDLGEQIDSRRRIAKLNDGTGLLEIVPSQSKRPEAEPPQHDEQAVDVALGCPDPDVQIARVAGMAVRGERIAADDQLLNTDGVE